VATLHTAQLALNPLVLYYCNETTGSIANDTSGNVNGPYNLTIGTSISKNSTKLVPSDTTGGSFFMSNATVGSAQTVTHSGVIPSYLQPTTGASTECVVSVFSTSTGSGQFSLTSNGTAGGEQMMIGTWSGPGAGTRPTGNLVYSTDGTTAVPFNLNPASTLTANAQHIVFTFTGGGGATPTATLYINSVPVGITVLPAGALLFYPSANTGGPTMYNDSQLAIANPFMRISNAAIYGYGLSASQVANNYSAFIGPSGGVQPPRFDRFNGFHRF
jgi:hypothetical protein